MSLKTNRRGWRLAWPALAGAAFLVSLSNLPFQPGTGEAEAKTPERTYCFYRKCHRVKTLGEMQALVGKTKTLVASYYDHCSKDAYNPCGLTSSGEQFFPNRADNAASPIYPDGTRLLVWSPLSKKAAVVRINNAGPYWGNRTLDVSRALADTLGFSSRGVAKVEVKVLSAPTKVEARYKRKRRYRDVHGPIGTFDSLSEAHDGLMVLLAFDALAASVMAPVTGAAVTSTERPFDVAAQAVPGGRVFAALSKSETTKLAAWPVVAPVGTSASRDGVIRVASLKTWPVVKRGPQPSAKTTVRLASLADDWPVVLDIRPQVRTPAESSPAMSRRTRTVRRSVASGQRSLRRGRSLRKALKQTARTRKAQRKAAPQKQKATTRKVVSQKANRKRVVRAAQRPVATRSILHRALGRGG